MAPSELHVGDVVQISPESENDFFAGCFMLVTEPKSWGAQGFVAIPQSRNEPPGHAFTRVPWANMELVGRAPWVPRNHSDFVEEEGEE